MSEAQGKEGEVGSHTVSLDILFSVIWWKVTVVLQSFQSLPLTRYLYFLLSLTHLSSFLLHSVYPEHPATQISLPGAVGERLRDTEKKRRHRSLGAVSLSL